VAQYFDWLAHLLTSPGKQMQLVEKAFLKSTRLAIYISPAATTPTFRHASRRCRKIGGFNQKRGSMALQRDLSVLSAHPARLHNATTGVVGVL
jgi:polyhydroxyalkanoate synthase